VSDYPRPQWVREAWYSLDGPWVYAFEETKEVQHIAWQGDIHVPYPPESSLSGLGNQAFHPVIWYQRTFSVPDAWQGKRIHLHFGAVDYRAEIWVNGRLVATHEGGHTPFSADITDVLTGVEETLTVRAEDDPQDMQMPRGKQDWLAEPHVIWYPRTTGIWQSVWLEPVSDTHLEKVHFTPELAQFGFLVDVHVAQPQENLTLKATFKHGDKVLAEDSLVLFKEAKRFIHLSDPGIDDARRALLWSPEHPNLINVVLQLYQGDTKLDEVTSYTALRTVEARGGAFYLNGRPYFLRLVLDQGYWDESLLAAPDSGAFKKDVELAKAMGFNGVRKHQKIEDPRYLYWADTLGLLVWEELPSAYRFSATASQRLTREWLDVIDRDYNHPCIVAWVCFNESWGVPDLPHSQAQRNLVAGLYHLTKALDPNRPVIGNDGWEHVVTDLLTIHDYTPRPDTLRERYATPEASEQTLTRQLEHGRPILLADTATNDEPKILSEFGGVRYASAAEGWGYQQVEDAEALLELYAKMISAVSGSGLAGFCYTQFADTFQEQNGLLYSDRRPKVPLEALYEATRGRS
jgi:beta-galactosidase/beta-glucuronidase